MRFKTALLCFSVLSVIGIGILGLLVTMDSDPATGMAVQKTHASKIPAFPKYCHGWENGIKACFLSNNLLKLFRCENYYWVPIDESRTKCCTTYSDCSRTAIFIMPSYCDQNTRLCKTR